VRCYVPSTSAIVALVFIGYLALREMSGPAFAAVGVATWIVIALGVAGAAAAVIMVSAATIRGRRAAAGACHTCSHPCREALVPKPELDAPRWPHRPLAAAQLRSASEPWFAQAGPATERETHLRSASEPWFAGGRETEPQRARSE